MSCGPVPDEDHVIRSCAYTTLDGGKPTASSFLPRQPKENPLGDGAYEEHLSAFWQERYGISPLLAVLTAVRSNGKLTVGGQAKLAILEVGTAASAVEQDTGIELTALHLPLDGLDEHAGFSGYDPLDQDGLVADMAEALSEHIKTTGNYHDAPSRS